ncbi:hypothetical protein [Actinomadura rubrisoli]|uniref:Uncharacterized protein n=1 Tax=Actinomadura rubrisoli TaxID=2530368 RepID=A0A4R4ZRI0_9ACTN|nr:hypothetical protein [Actinomadura rubrisoli]TDD60826.1 hypothetical protein E1298_45775 [Actinomadura rubrisoli]
MGDQSDNATTIREVIAMLNTLAADLPEGMDTRVKFGICDGADLQMVDDVDLSHYTHVKDGRPVEVFVMFRGHVHPEEEPGPRLRGAAAHVDEELRELLEDEDE